MPPIVIKDFQWSENAEWVFITIEMKGVRTGSTDVVSSPTYLRVHYAPFIFEAFLRNEVDDTQSECTIDENSWKVTLRLKKASAGLIWEQLENKELTKDEKREIRKEALQIMQQRNEQEIAAKQKQKFERKQATVHEQIQLDAVAREQVTKAKTFETEQALKDFNSVAISQKANNNVGVDEKLSSEKSIIVLEDKKVKNSKTNQSASTQIFDLPKKEDSSKLPSDTATHPVGIRPTACISVNFTPRIFPTPARESKHLEEQEWLKKQAEARRLCGFVDSDLRPEERNPQWLLDKGLSLMKAESFLGAISAFSLGIRLAPKMPELYVERAGAHLARKNYHRTVEDCSQALELLTPKVEANEEDRLNCHIRRGTAFRELNMLEDALADYNQAIALNPKNVKELTETREEIQALRAEQMKSEEDEKKVKDCRKPLETLDISKEDSSSTDGED